MRFCSKQDVCVNSAGEASKCGGLCTPYKQPTHARTLAFERAMASRNPTHRQAKSVGGQAKVAAPGCELAPPQLEAINMQD
jgi:hypothetical protein